MNKTLKKGFRVKNRNNVKTCSEDKVTKCEKNNKQTKKIQIRL